MPEKRADVDGVRPQSPVFDRNAKLLSHVLSLPVRYSHECGDACDAATGDVLLYDWFHPARLGLLTYINGKDRRYSPSLVYA
jgi:hypothetical protein